MCEARRMQRRKHATALTRGDHQVGYASLRCGYARALRTLAAGLEHDLKRPPPEEILASRNRRHHRASAKARSNSQNGRHPLPGRPRPNGRRRWRGVYGQVFRRPARSHRHRTRTRTNRHRRRNPRRTQEKVMNGQRSASSSPGRTRVTLSLRSALPLARLRSTERDRTWPPILSRRSKTQGDPSDNKTKRDSG